jgi:hypothetical protein
VVGVRRRGRWFSQVQFSGISRRTWDDKHASAAQRSSRSFEPAKLRQGCGILVRDLVRAVESFMTAMRDAAVADRHAAFEEALAGNRRKYPTRELRLFAEAVRRYVEKTGNDEMIHRNVTGVVHWIVDLRVERKRVPSEVLVEAERLECLFFFRLRSAPRRGRTSWSLGRPSEARFRVGHFGSMVEGLAGYFISPPSRRIYFPAWQIFVVRLPGESAAAPESEFRQDASRPGHRPRAGGQSGTLCRVRGPCLHPPAWS